MRQPWEWNETDLQSLIRDGVQESLSLDYKQSDSLSRSDGKKTELSKDVSAFANSAGGTIVYGMVERDQLPTELDQGFDPKDISREWLEQVINSRIQPRIDGIRIKSVDLTSTHPGRVAYVVSVPQSLRAPHQASDWRYYRRFNFQSVPMEDYEIRDVARRATVPVLELEARDLRSVPGNSDRAVEMAVQLAAHNASSATANFVVITLGMFQKNSATFPTAGDWARIDLTDDDWNVFRLVVASGSHPGWSPVTPGFRLFLPEFTLRTPVWEQDNFTPRTVGIVRLDHDGGAAVYRIDYRSTKPEGHRVYLVPGAGDPRSYLRSDLELHSLFALPSDDNR